MAKPQIDLKFGADLKGFRRGISNVDRSLKKLSGGFTALGGVMGASFAVDAIKQFVTESVDLANQAEGVRNAFERINDEKLLDNLRKATKGTINDLELMKMAVKAKNFNIPLEQLGNLLGFAQQRASETGESIDYMAESIVLGIARKSIPILDNLGFSATEVREEFNQTGDMATAVGNIIERQMADAGEATLTASEKIAQQRAEITNLKIAVGEQLQPVYTAFLDEVKSGLESVKTLLSEQTTGVEKMAYIASFFQGAQGKVLRIYLDAQVAARKATKEATEEQKNLGKETGNTTTRTVELTDAQQKAALKAAMLAHDISLATKEMQKFVMHGESVEMFEIAEDFEDASEVFEDFQANLNAIDERRAMLQQGFQQMGMILKSTFQDAFRPLEEGETRMEAFTDAFTRMLKQMIVDLLATAAAAALVAIAMTVAFGGAGAAGVQMFGTGFQGGFGSLFGQTFQGMGGLGFGGGFGGGEGGGGMNIMSVIRGEDILLVQERASNRRNRQTGG
jgi:hypothetical protein